MSKEANAPAIARPDKEAPVAPPARPLVTAKDIYEVPRLAVQGMLAWGLEACVDQGLADKRDALGLGPIKLAHGKTLALDMVDDPRARSAPQQDMPRSQ